MRNYLLLFFLAASAAFCQGLVSITGTIQLADGSPANGAFTIEWQAFSTATSIAVPAGSVNAVIVGGVIGLPGGGTIQLYPNVGATPSGTSYKILYSITGLSPYYMNWYVPQASSVTLNQIQFPPPGLVGQTAIVSPAQLTQSGATTNQALCWNGAFWAPGSCGGGGGGGISAVNGTANQISAATASGVVTLSLPSSILIPGSLTAGAGKSITFTGSGTVNANLINGVVLSSLGTGLLYNTTTTGVPSIATSTNVINLWSGCTGSNYLQSNGACSTPAGAGTVTSFSVTSVPSWLTSAVATPTSTPALTLSATTGQTSHQVIGTCGSATTFGPCALVSGDLPTISGANFANFTAHQFFGNNTGSTTTASASLIGTSDVSPNMYAADSGSANAYVACPTPSVTALANGASVRFTTTHPNTTTSTINVCSLGIKNITKNGATALVSGDILAAGMYEAVYDGTQWQLQNPSTSSGGSGATMASQLGDFTPTITTPNTVLTIGANCSASTPCNILLKDGVSGPNVISFTSSATATISAGSPTAYIYVDSVGVLSVGVATGTVVCSGCTTTAVAAFPAGSTPIWTWTSSAGAWVVGGGADKRGWLGNTPDTNPGTCLTGSGNTLNFDPTCAATLTNSNVTMPVTNAGSTGTTVNYLATINASGQAILATTSQTTIPVFIVYSGAGTSGSAQLGVAGQFTCTVDSAGSTAGDFIVNSTATNGRCMDAGATAPTSGYVIGQALSTVGANATVSVALGQGYNAAAGGSTPACISPFSRTCSLVQDDFYPAQYYGIGALGWQTQAVIGSGIAGPSNGENGHPGVVVIPTSSTSGDTTVLNLNSANSGGSKWLWLGSTALMSQWQVEFTIKTDDNASTNTSQNLELGFMDSAGYRTGNSIAFRYDTTSQTCTSGSNSTANWMLETFASGSSTCIDTTVAVAGASWYTFLIKSTTLGTIVAQVSSNGGSFSSPVTISTNVPTAAMYPQFLVGTRTSSPRRASIDWWELELVGLTR